MSGTGFQGRDPNRDDKPHIRLPISQSHIPVVPSPMQPAGDLMKSYHAAATANLKVRPIVPAPVSNVNIAAAQVVTPNIIPKIPTVVSGTAINLTALQPGLSGVTLATTESIVSLAVTTVSGATQPPLSIPSVSASQIPMASLIRGVQPVIQQPVNQTSVSSHSTLIAPRPVQFPLQVPRAPSQGTPLLRQATPVMSTHAGAAAILSSYIQPARTAPMVPVRPATPSTPPVTRSGSPAVSITVPLTQDQHRPGTVPQTVVNSSTVSSMQFTIQQQQRQVIASKPLNIPQPVISSQHKVVVTSISTIQPTLPVSSTVKSTVLPLNLVQTHAQVSVTSTVSTASSLPGQPSIPVAKVPPQRQVAHGPGPVRELREVSVASTGSGLQTLHRASPITTTASTATSIQTTSSTQMSHTDTRSQDSRHNVMQPYNYAEYYNAAANLMTNPYLMYQHFSQFSQGATGSQIKPGIVQTQASNLVATLQPGSTTAQQAMRVNPMVVTVDPSRHSTMPTHVQLKPASDGHATSTGTSVTAVSAATHVVTSLQSAINQHSVAVQPPGTNPTASPRPSILRKRPAEGVPMVKKSLASALSAVENPLPEVISQSLTASPKAPPYNPSGDNSQSSTDTAASAESTPPSTHGESKPTITTEQVDSLENGPLLSAALLTPGTPVSTNEASPRKKPRKQCLHATEELKDDESSTDDEVERISAKMDLNRHIEQVNEQFQQNEGFKELLDEYVDDEGIRWVRERKRPNITLMNHYTCTWKTKNNHFLRYQDVKCKEERRPTVNELSNQKGVAQKASGWKLYHLAGQMEEMMDLEKDVFCKLQEVQDAIAPKGIAKCTMEDDIGMVHELSQGSIQRCKLLTDQLGEAKASMIRILEHKDRILSIIQKHHSKRPVKKKERT